MGQRKQNSYPNIGDIVIVNGSRGNIIEINKDDEFLWAKVDNIATKVPIFIDQMKAVGIEKRGQIVWDTNNEKQGDSS